MALTLALELNINEAEDLLGRAGFALSKAVPEDIVVSYFLVHQIYSVLALNEILYAFAALAAKRIKLFVFVKMCG